MSELVPINILIGDRTYRIRTAPEDEETVRKTVKIINDKVIEFKTQFAGKDMQDYIAMVIIWYATQQAAENGGSIGPEILEGLTRIESLLEKAS